jgi:hypothetical protein
VAADRRNRHLAAARRRSLAGGPLERVGSEFEAALAGLEPIRERLEGFAVAAVPDGHAERDVPRRVAVRLELCFEVGPVDWGLSSRGNRAEHRSGDEEESTKQGKDPTPHG